MRVATSLFTKHGYAATSLVDIARGAGVASRTLYQHFGGKELIFHDVMFARETAAVFPRPELAPNDTLFDAMMKAANYACEVTFRPQTIDLMRLAVGESNRFPEMMKALINASNSRFRANVTELIDDLVNRRMIKDPDTAEAADMFIHLIIGDTSLLSIGGWKPDLPSAEQLRKKVDLFILGRWGPAAAKKAHDPEPRARKRASKPGSSGKAEITRKPKAGAG